MAKPVVKVPAPPAKTGKGATAVYKQMVAKYHIDRQVAADVLYWSKREQIDPIYVLSVMMAESRGKANIPDSSAGAIGIMQVEPGIHNIPWGQGGKATDQWLRNYANNIRLGIYLLAQAVHNVGYSRAYSGVQGVSYNYGGGTPYAKYTPKGYIYGSGGAGTGGTAPETAAANTIANQQAKTASGLDFLQRFPDISSIWEAYTGKPATKGQALAVYKAGWTNYHLELQLSKGKAFTSSPVWKQNAPTYLDIFRQIYGEKAKPDKQLIAYGIIHNSTTGGFATLLRQRKDYVQSNEFKTAVSGLSDVYKTIYGEPDEKGLNTIKLAAINGWNSNQFAKYLRDQPEYKHSQEYGSQVNNIMDTLGGILGAVPTMTPGGTAGGATRTPPPDKRVPGAPGLNAGPSYTPGFS